MKKIITTLAVVMASLSFAFAQATGIAFVENKTWKEVLERAGTENKLIFLDCYTSWCGPCKAMAQNVFPLSEVGEFMNKNFINVKQDMEKGEGVELNKRYKQYIPGYPTYLLINSKGEVVHQFSGYNESAPFIQKIREGLEGRSWIAMTARYDAGERDWNFVRDYLNVLGTAFQTNKQNEVKAQALADLTIDAISADTSAYWVFRENWKDVNNPLLLQVVGQGTLPYKFKDKPGDFKDWASKLYRAEVESVIRKAIENPTVYDGDKSEKLQEDLLKSGVPNSANMITLLKIHDAVNQGNATEFFKLVEFADKVGMLTYETTRLSGWSKQLSASLSDQSQLSTLLALSERVLESRFVAVQDLTNYAFILNRLGKKKEAASYEKKAVEREAEIEASFKKMTEK